MIVVGTDIQDQQTLLPCDRIPDSSLGEELPSQSCDLFDLNISSNELDQIMESFSDLTPNSLDACLHPIPVSYSSGPQKPCNIGLSSLFIEDTPRPRDLNLSLPGELTHEIHSALNQSLQESLLHYHIPGSITPPLPGGITPINQSRAVSPTWSESSGNLSSATISGSESTGSRRGSNPLPRHKRASHKRAEIKRRDKIKCCLDEIKLEVPSLRDKGKLSESAILTKAAEFIHHLKDGCGDRASKAQELRREIACLSAEIHSCQDNLPASGVLKDDSENSATLDQLYQKWVEEKSNSTKFSIFSSITSNVFNRFKEVFSPALTLDSLATQAKEWQENHLCLPVLRKDILSGMLSLTKKSSLISSLDPLSSNVSFSDEDRPQTHSKTTSFFDSS